MSSTSTCYACSRSVAAEESKLLADGRTVCKPCDLHQFKFDHTDLAVITSTGNPASNPYYTAWCSCMTWRSRRFGHPINDTDKQTKAAQDALAAWREHIATPVPEVPVEVAQVALF